MIFLFSYIDFFNSFFLIYAVLLFTTYLLIGIFSTFELKHYLKKNRHFDYRNIITYKKLPSISIIAPAYNEEQSIVINIRSLLSLYYPKVEVIIVNDGSKDNSMQKIISQYNLVKVKLAIDDKIKTARVKAIYKSLDNAYSNLTVIDKENGGKADALNAGINLSRNDLFLAVDVDSIIEPDAILRLVKPFLEEEGGKRVITSGGVVRVANNCEIKGGRITKVIFPKKLLAKFQVLEYLRAFTLGRIAWSKIDGLLIISGAFGLFDRKIVESVGGYDTSTVGEDLELVVRMRKYMRDVAKTKYRVAFIPDPLCWTEVPSSYKILSRQRNRWTRGAIDTILKHKNMLFNPKYGRIGMLSFPYWVFFEWLAPIVEIVGLIYFIVLLFIGGVNIKVFIILSIFILSFALAFSTLAILYESYIFNIYKGRKFLFKIILTSLAEIIIFHPLNVIFSISGNIDFFFKKDKKTWGEMTRTAFDS